ncbi:MAG: flagellin lysine-N-methylase [Clostridia bacterium]|nr:flagellin lysine-N-methylase [Clostridia bacterium]
MKVVVPSYYGKFKCIASACRHSCCVGWEIDVDEDTLEYYKSVGGRLGDRLRENISEDEGAHFVLGENERCPFLNSENLCDIICELGEESLCQICSDHPRYRSFFSDREEMGIGLCCEEAARIIVSETDKMTLTVLSDDGEDDIADPIDTEFYRVRDEMLAIVQNRQKPITERLSDLAELCGISEMPSEDDSISLFRELEYMEQSIYGILSGSYKKEKHSEQLSAYETAFEQLSAYFIFRHMPASIENGSLRGTAFFCILSVKIIMLMCEKHLSENGCLGLSDIAEAARIYSAEIEYSEENTDRLMNAI